MIRSCLYVPADRPDHLERAPTRDADALIVDLEDSIAPSAREQATADAADWLRHQPAAAVSSGPSLWVRVNPGPTMRRELEAVVGPALTGLVIPKCETVDALGELDAALEAIEANVGIAPGSIAVAPLIETAGGVLRAERLAASPRVARLQIGEADLCAQLGLHPTSGDPELIPLRLRVVLASANAGLVRPIGPVWTALDDLDGLRTSSMALRSQGFGGRSAIHPNQLTVINEVFTPTPGELDRARQLVETYDRALDAGSGVLRDDSGTMIDEAMVRAAREMLADYDA